jgi:hypothetical protein
VLGELGRGGMGVVFQARHLATRRLVALKVLRDGLDEPRHRARFRTEADVLTRIRHPNIVQLLDAGEHDGRPFFVMELVTGGSLDRYLADRPHPPRVVAQQVATLARALHVAHQAGIVHRDLKPGNILLTVHGDPDVTTDSDASPLDAAALKVTDFGLDKQLDAGVHQTTTGAILGTPAYMSPEQAAGHVRDIGPATDVHALGVLLYQMLTGRPPFQAATTLEVLEQVRTQDPTPPGRLRGGVSRDLDTICLKCLQKDPARRYATAADLADDLQRYLDDRPIRARPVGPRERLTKWRRRNPVGATVLACAAALLLVAGVAGLWYWDAYHRAKVEYYTNMVRRFGLPHGLGRVGEEDARRRQTTYRFTRRGGRVEQVEVVNGSGRYTTEHDEDALLDRREPNQLDEPEKECRFAFHHDQGGNVLRQEAFDRNGNLVWALQYTTPTTAHYTDRQGYPRARTGSGAAYVEFVWSPAGFEQEVRYRDRNGNRHPTTRASSASATRWTTAASSPPRRSWMPRTARS